ncbi:MAG: 2-phosphosulfolactate phosphatase [Candidatus Pacebacteria bacterium]|nr:2-phosphosulfolactate phosphatase [Candidatus Paceibacterota bacterium]
MQIQIIRSLEDAHKAIGLAVIIDVYRAFTTEAYIFANGAEKIIPVLDLEEAHKLKKENPEYVLVGERKGVKPEGFDFGNGPTEVLDVDFRGKTIVHSTMNGTKGLINAINAEVVLTGSFVVADSIIKYIKKNNIQNISLVSTAPHPEADNEDILLAYYIRDVLEGKEVNELDIKEKLATTSVAAFLLNEAGVPQSDIDLCLDFHRFDFVIKKVVENDLIYLVRENI